MQLQEFGRWIPEVWGQTPLEDWRERLHSVCGRFHPYAREGVKRVTGGVTLADAGGMEIVQVATDIEIVRRDQRDIRLDGGEHFFLLLQLEGPCGVENHGRQSLLSPGDCILVDSASPSTFFFGGRFSNHLSVHLPRQLLLAQAPNAFEPARCIHAADPMSTLLRTLVAKMLQTDAGHARAPQLRQLLLHMTRQAFARDRADEPTLPNERASGRLELARILIDRHLTDERLTPPWLATRLGISLRTLQEDFSTLGATVTGFIRERRLRLARDRLMAIKRGVRGGAIAEIAYASGFNDISYFNRCFRKAFDCSPGQVGRSL